MSDSFAARDAADEYFVKTVKSDYVLPLREELASVIDGYAGMDWRSRFARVIDLNAPLYGTGDCLPLGIALVFAGVRLGEEVFVGTAWNGNTGTAPAMVRQYQPRFSDRHQLTRSYALGVEESILPRKDAASRLHEFLRGELIVHEYQTGDRVTYEDLPAAYRAALLALYLGARVVAPVEEIVAFILGDSNGHGEELHSADYMAVPVAGIYGRQDGWLARFRGSEPSNALMDALAGELRQERGPIVSGRERDGDRVKRREPRWIQDQCCRWVYDYEQRTGKRAGKEISWPDIRAKMQIEVWELGSYYEETRKPDSLRTQYGRWKKRNGLD